MAREKLFIIELVFDPCHEVFNILIGGHLDWCFCVWTFSPSVFVSKTVRKLGTGKFYFGPAAMIGQVSGEQNSVKVPYMMLISL